MHSEVIKTYTYNIALPCLANDITTSAGSIAIVIIVNVNSFSNSIRVQFTFIITSIYHSGCIVKMNRFERIYKIGTYYLTKYCIYVEKYFNAILVKVN